MMKGKLKKTVALLLALAALSGCSAQPVGPSPSAEGNPFIDDAKVVEIVNIEDEAVALSQAPAPAVSIVLRSEAPGTKVQKSGTTTIDYSNIEDGYVMVQATSSMKLKVQVFGPSYDVDETKYTYNLESGKWTTFPLSDGNGSYKVVVYENVTGKSYSTLLSASFNVQLEDEFAPFLRPNQYVNYEENAENAVAKAAELAEGLDDPSDPLQKVEAVYKFVVENITYDTKKANEVKKGGLTGYLPVLDETLESGKGICFDYAALMVGMLRSLDVPCKLVVGYASKQYHAWVSVWTEETGWVDGAIFFDGTTWHRMDPTFISSGKNSAGMQKYVGNGKNYTEMYLY